MAKMAGAVAPKNGSRAAKIADEKGLDAAAAAEIGKLIHLYGWRQAADRIIAEADRSMMAFMRAADTMPLPVQGADVSASVRNEARERIRVRFYSMQIAAEEPAPAPADDPPRTLELETLRALVNECMKRTAELAAQQEHIAAGAHARAALAERAAEECEETLQVMLEAQLDARVSALEKIMAPPDDGDGLAIIDRQSGKPMSDSARVSLADLTSDPSDA